MITLYGITGSRALRCIWALEEVGVSYEVVRTHFIGDSKKPEYLAINPNGRVPTMVDGELTLFESMAINLYLAKKYGGELWPAAEDAQALAVQWSFWGMTELEPHLIAILLNRIMLPEAQRKPQAAEAGEAALDRPLQVLERSVGDRAFLLGDEFTIADLNVASVLSMSSIVGFALTGYPKVEAWLASCVARPSMERARAR